MMESNVRTYVENVCIKKKKKRSHHSRRSLCDAKALGPNGNAKRILDTGSR